VQTAAIVAQQCVVRSAACECYCAFLSSVWAAVSSLVCALLGTHRHQDALSVSTYRKFDPTAVRYWSMLLLSAAPRRKWVSSLIKHVCGPIQCQTFNMLIFFIGCGEYKKFRSSEASSVCFFSSYSSREHIRHRFQFSRKSDMPLSRKVVVHILSDRGYLRRPVSSTHWASM